MLNKFFENKNIDRAMFAALCCFLFAYGVYFWGFLQFGHMAIGVVALAIYVIYKTCQMGSVPFDMRMLFLMMLYIITCCRDMADVDESLGCRTVIPVLFYLTGVMLVGNEMSQAAKRSFIGMMSFACGYFIQGLLDLSVDFNGEEEFSTENWNRFWTGTEQSRTLFTLDFILITSTFVFAIMIFKKHKVLSIISFVLNLFIQVMDVKVEGRYNICLLVGDLLVLGLVYLHDNWDKLSDNFKKLLFRVVIGAIAVIAVIAIVFALDIGGIQDKYMNSYWGGSGGIIHNVRYHLYVEAIQKVFTETNLGFYIEFRGESTTHNSYMEFARAYGIAPFAMLVAFIVLVLKDVVTLALDKSAGVIKYLLVAASLNMIVYFFLEPSGHRYYNVFSVAYFVYGILHGYVNNRRAVWVKWPKEAYVNKG